MPEPDDVGARGRAGGRVLPRAVRPDGKRWRPQAEPALLRSQPQKPDAGPADPPGVPDQDCDGVGVEGLDIAVICPTPTLFYLQSSKLLDDLE